VVQRADSVLFNLIATLARDHRAGAAIEDKERGDALDAELGNDVVAPRKGGCEPRHRAQVLEELRLALIV